ncbi:hypothetical protein LCGC14_2883130 [marine sediment metagenome]|uniref:Uncharacterized protein n=1 Tax=marine sediment metagenome TaxID=412755 RepID=A0A0F8XZI1_9ZZZZ
MSNKGCWELKHKAYAIERLGQMSSIQKVLDELKDADIGTLFGFTPLPKDYHYMSLWDKMKTDKNKAKIQKARDEYIVMLKATLPITDDHKLLEYLQNIIDDSDAPDKDIMRAIELSHKIRSTPGWQKALGKSGSVTVQVIANIMAGMEIDDEV